MARTARSRAQPTHQSLYADSDSDGDENGIENSDYDATPKAPSRKGAPTKSKGKKRVSDVYHAVGPDRGAAEGSSPQRVPFRTVNINDDEAEKRRRRKSAKVAPPMMMVVDEEEVGSSQEGGKNETPKASRHLKHKQQLMAVAETPEINVPLDVMSSNFEEWMKMATDNVCLPIVQT